MEVQNGDGFGFYGSLEHCGQIREGSTFQRKSLSVEEVPKAREEGHIHHRPQLGGQPTCAY